MMLVVAVAATGLLGVHSRTVTATTGEWTPTNRAAAEDVWEPDPVSEDMLIGHLHSLEQFHWFVRAHLELSGGGLAREGADSETEAATRSAAVDGWLSTLADLISRG